MATLEGGQLGPDPGALSPAQLEQLRNFKVGAPPPECSSPRIRAQAGGRTPGEGGLFPMQGRRLGENPGGSLNSAPAGASECREN